MTANEILNVGLTEINHRTQRVVKTRISRRGCDCATYLLALAAILKIQGPRTHQGRPWAWFVSRRKLPSRSVLKSEKSACAQGATPAPRGKFAGDKTACGAKNVMPAGNIPSWKEGTPKNGPKNQDPQPNNCDPILPVGGRKWPSTTPCILRCGRAGLQAKRAGPKKKGFAKEPPVETRSP